MSRRKVATQARLGHGFWVVKLQIRSCDADSRPASDKGVIGGAEGMD